MFLMMGEFVHQDASGNFLRCLHGGLRIPSQHPAYTRMPEDPQETREHSRAQSHG
jgi:hypothetical protein